MNDILHASPVLCNIAYAVFWSLFLLLGGLIGAPFMLLIYLPITTLYSICAAIGKFRQQATNKPQTGSPPQGDATTLAVVITGCDTGFGRELAEKVSRAIVKRVCVCMAYVCMPYLFVICHICVLLTPLAPLRLPAGHNLSSLPQLPDLRPVPPR